MTGITLVTDRHLCGPDRLIECVEAALRGGVAAVQLREKDLDARALLDLAAALLPPCRRAGVPLLINDRIDVALASGADGVHLPGNSFRVGEARSLLGQGRIIGVSTHSPEEVAAAAAAGADFAFFGPIYATASKAGFGAPQGVEGLQAACAAASIPVIAIGGITPARMSEIRRAGAAGAAVISAILATADAASAAAAFHL